MKQVTNINLLLSTQALFRILKCTSIGAFCLFIPFLIQAQCLHNVNLYSQAEVDNFPTWFKCTKVDGSFVISGNDITDLSALSFIKSVGGTLNVNYNDILTNLDGLENITSVGSLVVANCPNLPNLDGLENINPVGFIIVNNNPKLANLDALANINSVGGVLKVESNDMLANLDGLANINSVGGYLAVVNNPKLPNLDGLANINSVLSLSIESNDMLANLDGLANINSVEVSINIKSNPNLANLDGLANINSVGGNLWVSDNPNLANLDGLVNINSVGSAIYISNNDMLANLDGLVNINSVEEQGLWVLDNDMLTNLDGLANINSVQGLLRIESNDMLANLDGLANINSVGKFLRIESNDILADCCGIYDLINTPGAIKGSKTINNNKTGCDSEPQVNTYCQDADMDGVNLTDGDCNDNDPNNFPGNAEVCDGQDNDCDGLVDTDDPNLTDNEDPVVICPAAIADVELGSDGNGTLPANIGDGRSIDNCGNVTETSPSLNFTCAHIGLQFVPLTADDGNGNSDTQVCFFNVVDNEKPIAVCPTNIPDVVLDANGNGTLPANIGDGSSTDNCSATETSPTASFTCADIGMQTVVLTASDGTNSDTENCTFNVVDNEKPIAVCPANIPDVVLDANGNGTLLANIGDGSSTDNCSATETSPTASFTCADIGMQTVVLTASDGTNSDTENCTFNVVDNEKPIAVCPANIPDVELDANGNGTLPANIGDGSSTDNCSATETSPTASFTCADIGVQMVMLTASDGTNSSTANCTFNVVDNEAPVAICPTNIPDVVLDANGNGTLPANIGDGSSTDNCSATETSPSLNFTCSNIGQLSITLTADDGNGNSDTETCFFNVVDNIDPVITCPADVTKECDESTSSIWTGVATATDNCAMPPAITESDASTQGAPGCPYYKYTITRTWTADDGNGNTVSCDQTIAVDDTTGPAITCPADVTVECDADHSPASTGTATAVDNCDTQPVAISSSDATTPGSCAKEWTITRTWTATDVCGNSTPCDQTITVEDNAAPTITCPANVTVECSGDHTSAATGTAFATDNCSAVGDITIGESDATTPGACANGSIKTRTWTATDECGKSSSCDQVVTVEDATAPVITCPGDITVECDASNTSAATGTATATDNCSAVGDITIGESDATTPGSCANEWTIKRTWTATDECGQSSSCDQTINVEDSTGPAMSCGTLTVTPNTDGTYALSQTEIDGLGAGSTDNCGNVTFSATPNSFDCGDEGANTVTVTGTDDCGNSNSCDAAVTVEPYLTIVSCTATGETCAGAGDGSINISATALGGQVKYSIDGGANYSASGTFNNLTPGTYNIVVKVFGIAEICEKTDTKTVSAGGSPQLWYKDADGDNYSDGNTITSCTQPTDYIANPLGGNDCNDADPAINPGATETCDGLDNDCDGIIPASETDADGDGYMVCENDCVDNDPDVNPGATEICNGIDDDCDGEVDEGVGSGLTWTGNVTFTTQAEVDAWLACYSIIDGNLTIMGGSITDLSSLIGLEEVTGLVFIYANGSLASLDGLDNLATVGNGLSIYYNFALADCCAIYDLLNNNGVTGSIMIFFNASGCNSQAEILSDCAPSSFTGGGQQAGAWDMNSVQDMSLFPNPASGTFSVRIPENAGTGQLSVVDIHGREMMGQQTEEGQSTYQFERGMLAPGIYLVVLRTSGKAAQAMRLVIE